jgi:flagellar biosynthesis protein FlhG
MENALESISLSSASAARRMPPGHTTLVISGGRPGVGATTIALQLATALAREAQRTVLIDADPFAADIAARCEHSAALGIGEVLAGRKTIHEVLQLGPAGMQILAGAASQQMRDSLNSRSIGRLLKQMRSLAPHSDWLIVDAGNQPSEMAAQLWSAADRLLVVTSPDAVAVMDTYALIETLLSRHSLRQAPLLVINQAADEATAADVHRRIDQSCRRFLGLAIEFAGWLPLDPKVKLAVMAAAALTPAVIALAHRLHQLQHSPAQHSLGQHSSGQRPLAA